nr:rifin PIR protein,putative [Plasmodium sp. DRC-Itaito]
MKLHCSKILLLFLPLNILVTSYQAHNTNKPYITPHHTQINRSLCESDTQSSNYDKNTGMKSVMQQFVDRTSQRFEEYKERLKEKRQKRKEQRDKNIEKIIEKDKRENSLAEKVEKGCLKCGCALGGVAASVGVFGGLGVYGSKTAALATAKTEAMVEGLATGEAARITEIIKEVIGGLSSELRVQNIGVLSFESFFTGTHDTNVKNIAFAINNKYNPSSCVVPGADSSNPICPWAMEKFHAEQGSSGKVSMYDILKNAVETIVTDAEPAAERAAQEATNEVIQRSIDAVESAYSGFQTAIIASVVALLIIALVMIIIYLVLRYRRKKKMNKKALYTKLLEE